MKYYSIIFVLFLFQSCTDCEENKEIVSDEYSSKLQTELVDMNKELKIDLEEIYAHFDISLAKQAVFHCFENMDSIMDRGLRLKAISYEFQNKIDKLLVFPLDQTDLNEIEFEMDTYRQTVFALIDTSHFIGKRRVQEVNEKLVFDDFQKLQVLSRNEFNIEKELVKSKLLRVEFILASQLLMELDLERSFFQ